ncbi:hypothetical protein BCR44DRAFT_1422446 [Catenaria anguillulae PL171]|uniref:Uncharacterized protein n=1 Tax=Catenaria anguillulae PL171 TaxID=765915 RepID=A0A1Y2I307_9FUNG|nr:hypothetical protein BCR44DRAFT_1422446 [Catenaria anguillulae PL171]
MALTTWRLTIPWMLIPAFQHPLHQRPLPPLRRRLHFGVLHSPNLVATQRQAPPDLSPSSTFQVSQTLFSTTSA